MGLLDRDSKILMDNKNKENINSSEGVDTSKKSKRTVGGQGLRRFGTLDQFNANIKPKTIENPVVEKAAEVVQATAVEQTTVIPKADPVVKINSSTSENFIATKQEVTVAPISHPVKTPEKISHPVKTSLEVQVGKAQADVITSEKPRQPTVNTTINPQKSHANTTDSARDYHDNDHVKNHVERSFQRSHLVDESIIYNIHSLPKYHRVIVEFMFSKCSQTGTNKTSHIFTSEILGITGMKQRTYEDALARLVEDKILTVIDVRKGRSGFRTFEIHSNIFAQLIQESRNPNKYHANHHVESHGFASSKEVSKLNNNITNYTQTSNVVIPKKFLFKDLDFSEIPLLHPMQVNSSIRKLAEEKLEKEEMQLFIDKFMVWMATQRDVKNPIAIFCSKIKEFAEEGDSAVMQCLSKKEVLAEKALQAEIEKIQLAQQLSDKYREEVASSAIETDFNIWISNLSNEQKLQFVPENNYAKLGSSAYTACLKAYFIENLSNQKL